ncbi:hypothetical protein BCR35DRAFT_331192 [Leucosporidium creatinivorum]|uniref:Zn(2)-C6 fungal-type domain-containing protein n=1 Tax=Leucosporidium creatinivorum TaxID=106004 RepID=A0A1Y2FHV3_9BASI|nr:hypothetical protein BCR35DRAFT_331192 [Leucosporidium creatinivorum]
MTKAPSPAHSRSYSWSSSDSVASPYPLPASRDAGGDPLMRKRRNRKHNSCEPCRAKKIKCDRQIICANCRLHKKECYYVNAEPLPPTAGTQPDELTAAHAEITRLRLLVSQLSHSEDHSTTTQPQLPLATPQPNYSFPPRSLSLDSPPWSESTPWPSSSSSSSGRSSFSSDLSTGSDVGFVPPTFPLTLPPPPTPSSLSILSQPLVVSPGAKDEQQGIDLTGIDLELEMALKGVKMEEGFEGAGGWGGTVEGEGGGGEWWEEFGAGL